MERPRAEWHRRGERGVTLVEYVLFIGLFGLVAVGAVTELNSTARAYFAQASSRIGQPINRIQFDPDGNRPQLASTTTITAPPPTSTTTTATTTTTTTTLAPTTTTPSTTTTSSTSTTTSPRRLSTILVDQSDEANGSNWDATVQVTLSATGGASKSNIKIDATFTKEGGGTTTKSCTTNSSGVCSMTWSKVNHKEDWVDVEITGVTSGASWTGSVDATRLYKP